MRYCIFFCLLYSIGITALKIEDKHRSSTRISDYDYHTNLFRRADKGAPKKGSSGGSSSASQRSSPPSSPPGLSPSSSPRSASPVASLSGQASSSSGESSRSNPLTPFQSSLQQARTPIGPLPAQPGTSKGDGKAAGVPGLVKFWEAKANPTAEVQRTGKKWQRPAAPQPSPGTIPVASRPPIPKAPKPPPNPPPMPPLGRAGRQPLNTGPAINAGTSRMNQPQAFGVPSRLFSSTRSSPPSPAAGLARQNTISPNNKPPIRGFAGLPRSKSSGELGSKDAKKVKSVPFLPRKTRDAIQKLPGNKLPMGDPKDRPTRPSPKAENPPPSEPSRSRMHSFDGIESASRPSMDSTRSSRKDWLPWNFKKGGNQDGRDSKDTSRSRMPWWSGTQSSARPSVDSQASRGTSQLSSSPFATLATQGISIGSAVDSQTNGRKSTESKRSQATATSGRQSQDMGHILSPPESVRSESIAPSSRRGGNTRPPSQAGPSSPQAGKAPSDHSKGSKSPKLVAGTGQTEISPANGDPGPPPSGSQAQSDASGKNTSGKSAKSKKSCFEQTLCALGAQSYYGESNPGAVNNFIGSAAAGVTTVAGVTLSAASFPAHGIIGPIIVGTGITGALAMGVHNHVNSVRNHTKEKKIAQQARLERGRQQTVGLNNSLVAAKNIARAGSRALGIGSSTIKKAASVPTDIHKMDEVLERRSLDDLNNLAVRERRHLHASYNSVDDMFRGKYQ